MRNESRGYIAISRSIFDHPEFKENRPFTRLEAWQWLICEAAWRAKTKRFKYESVRLERGQVSVSIKVLAGILHWPKSNVGRFLKRLQALDMITCLRTGTLTGTINGKARNIITICNYEKFNRSRKKLDPQADPRSVQASLQPLLLPEKFALQPTNQLNKESKGGEVTGTTGITRTVLRSKPSHGAKGKGMIWFDWGTQEWKLYAEDFKTVRGADILPENRPEGRGNWFRFAGEASGRRRA